VAVFRSVSKVAVREDIKLVRRTIEAENFAGLKDHSVDYFAVFIERKSGRTATRLRRGVRGPCEPPRAAAHSARGL
jgi:hypothetical protein